MPPYLFVFPGIARLPRTVFPSRASAGLDGAGRLEVVVLTTNHAVVAWNSVTSWSVLAPPAPAADLVASTTGRLVAILSNGALFAHDEVFGWFAPIGPNYALA